MAEARKPRLEIVEEETPIEKPSAFNLNKFKSKQAAAMANVETLQTGLAASTRSPQAKDFVRLHPDEETYWSPELCFVNVPIKGQKRDTLHLIDEDLALQLPAEREDSCASAWHWRPSPTTSSSSATSRPERGQHVERKQPAGCEQAKTLWVQATSRKEEGVDAYKIDLARDADAFPEPKWPTADRSTS